MLLHYLHTSLLFPNFVAVTIVFSLIAIITVSVSGTLKRYYIAAEVENKRRKPITVKWRRGNSMNELEIQPNSSKTIDAAVQATSSPESLNLTVFDRNSSERIDILGRKFYEVIPRIQRTVDKLTICKLAFYFCSLL